MWRAMYCARAAKGTSTLVHGSAPGYLSDKSEGEMERGLENLTRFHERRLAASQSLMTRIMRVSLDIGAIEGGVLKTFLVTVIDIQLSALAEASRIHQQNTGKVNP